MPITNPLPIVNPVVQEVKPVVKLAPTPTPTPVPAVKPENELKVGVHGGLKYAKPGGDPLVPPAATTNGTARLVNSVPQTVLPHPPQDSYLCNAIR
jgi:hypothetical protein